MLGKPTIHTIIEQLFQAAWWTASVAPRSRKATTCSRVTVGKPQELIDRVIGLKIIEQGLHGHARAREDGRATHDVRRSADHVSADFGACHGDSSIPDWRWRVRCLRQHRDSGRRHLLTLITRAVESNPCRTRDAHPVCASRSGVSRTEYPLTSSWRVL